MRSISSREELGRHAMASLALLEGGPNGERRPSREMDDSFIPPEAATFFFFF